MQRRTLTLLFISELYNEVAQKNTTKNLIRVPNVQSVANWCAAFDATVDSINKTLLDGSHDLSSENTRIVFLPPADRYPL